MSARGERSFGLRARAKWWPPFVATEFLAPRYRIEITNPGDEIESLRLQVAVASYTGLLEDLPELPYQWREVIPYRRLGAMKTGGSHTVHVTIPTGLLDEGTYVVRLHLMAGSRVNGQLHHTSSLFVWFREYLRVEPLSSVLTLMVALGTFLTAFTTLALVLFN